MPADSFGAIPELLRIIAKTLNKKAMTSNELIAAIITSFIAAVIFWFVFNFIPSKCELKKVKPMIDYNLYQIYFNLSFFLQIPFCPKLTHSMYSQNKFNNGQFTMEDFRLFLSTKCLNEDYQKIDETAKLLLPIGETLKKDSQKILEMIQGTYVFNKYLSAEQIILCRKIADKLSMYSFDLKAFDRDGNMIFHPVDPTLKYMSKMFFELYQLYLQLQRMLIDEATTEDEFGNVHLILYRRKMDILYSQKQYDKVVSKTKRKNDRFLRSLHFRSLLQLDKTKEGIKEIIMYLNEDKEKLIYLRGIFSEFVDNPTVTDTLIKVRSAEEYQEMIKCLQDENDRYENYKKFALQLRGFYDNKSRENTIHKAKDNSIVSS